MNHDRQDLGSYLLDSISYFCHVLEIGSRVGFYVWRGLGSVAGNSLSGHHEWRRVKPGEVEKLWSLLAARANVCILDT